MDKPAAKRILQTMIDYFEAGNRESDQMAKTILEWDSEFLPDWQEEIKRRRETGEWSGLRGPEADIIADALRSIQAESD